MAATGDRTIRTTCPRDCYDACGALIVVRDGAIHAVRGDPDHAVSRGKLCRKCALAYNGAFLDPELRLSRPLRRVGPKGSGRFEPISWAAALAEIAARLGAIREESGPEAILNAHYTGTFALLGYSFGQRFFNRLGATEVDPDTVCNNAGHVALGYLYGDSEEGFDPRTAADSGCILVWGANPSASAPHQDEYWLPESPATVVVVDPIRTPTAASADLHLAPAPGTDAALAFALMHVLVRDGLHDVEFLAEHTVGFEELEPRLRDAPPEWGEAVTGVPAVQIEEAAHLYGEGPSLLWLGQALQRQAMGGNAIRSCALLPALTGNVARPGSGFVYLNGTAIRGIDDDRLAGEHLAATARPVVSQMDLAERLEDTARSRALFCWNINIAASNPQQARLRAAMEREDLLTVAIDLFATDTVDLADYVLPAASWLECDDLVLSYFNLSVAAQRKGGEPPGEALPNTEIFRRLAAAMEFAEPELYEGDDELIAGLLEETGIGIDFEQLCEVGTVAATHEPRMQFAELRFATPSGRIEIVSEQAAADGLPRLPLPHADPRPAAGRLRLLTPASPWMLNDTFTLDRKISSRIAAAQVALHPAEAESRGIRAGDAVVLENATGSLRLEAAISAVVPRGVAYAPKGRWPKREPSGANVNVLNPGAKSDMGESSAVHGVEVSLRLA